MTDRHAGLCAWAPCTVALGDMWGGPCCSSMSQSLGFPCQDLWDRLKSGWEITVENECVALTDCIESSAVETVLGR